MRTGNRTRLRILVAGAIVVALLIISVLFQQHNSPAPKTETKPATTVSTPVTQTPATNNPQPTTTPQTNPVVTLSEAAGLIADFNTKYGYPLPGTSLCAQVAAGTYNSELSVINGIVGYLPEQDSLTVYFNYAGNACSDGKLDQSEYAQILTLHAQVGNHEGNLLHWHLIVPFENEISQYFITVFGNGVTPDCSKVNAVTADDFSAHVAFVENGYHAPSYGSDLKQTLLDAQTACKTPS